MSELTLKRTSYTLVLVLLLAGCAGGGSKRGSSKAGEIGIPNIPPASVSNTPLNVNFKPYVFVDLIKDQRQFAELARVSGDKLEPRGRIETVVQYAIRNTFRRRGFTVTDNAPVVVVPAVKKWLVTVNASQGLAEAVIAIDVLDPGNQSIYSSTYDGFIQFAPTEDKGVVSDKLGDVMAKALSQMISDPQLLDILTAF